MKPKQLVILAVILVAAIVAVIVSSNRRNKAGEGGTAEVGKAVFPDLKVNDVARIAIAGPKGSVTLAQKDGVWGVENRGGYAADVAKVRTFVLDLSKLKVAQTTSAGASQLGRLGLLAPDSSEGSEEETGTVIEFASADGTKLVKATVGKEFKTGGASADPMMGGGYATGRYLLVDGRDDVFVVSDQLYSLQSEPAGWLQKESFRVEKPKTVTVTYPEEGEGSFTLSKEEESGQFKLADLSETETLDDAKTGGYGNIFSSGSFADVLVGDEASDEKTGLDKPTTVEVETFDGFTYGVSIGKKIPEGGGEDTDEEDGASPSAIVRYPVRFTVSAELPTERKVEGETEETEEEKKERDAAFELKQVTGKEKLAKESALAGTVYLMDSWVIDQVLKKRADLLKLPDAEGDDEESAAAGGLPPGISVTSPPVQVPPPGDRPPITATTPPVSLEDAIREAAEKNAEGGDASDEEMEPEPTPEPTETPDAEEPSEDAAEGEDEPDADSGEEPDSGTETEEAAGDEDPEAEAGGEEP